MQRLLVYQSMWAMERRRPDGAEWSLDEKLALIHVWPVSTVPVCAWPLLGWCRHTLERRPANLHCSQGP